MKKLLFALFLMLPSIVFASEVKVTGTGYEVTKHNPTGTYVTTPFEYHYVDGKISYCVEPGVEIGKDGYVGSNDFTSYMGDEKKNKLQLIHYYGYETHPTLEYYMATQELIWEEMGATEIVFKNSTTQEIFSTQSIKNEILNKVKNHSILPDYANKTYYKEVGEVFKLPYFDDRFTAQDYSDEHSAYLNFTEKTKVFHFKQKAANGISILYRSLNDQTLATFYLSANQKLEFDVNVVYYEKKGKIEITKTGDILTGINNGEFTFQKKFLDDVTYGIYAKEDIVLANGTTKYYKDKLVTKIKTKDGIAQFDKLYYGNYYIKEIDVPKDFLIDSQIYEFTIDDEHKEVKFNFHNKRKLLNIEINKKGEFLDKIENNKGIFSSKVLDGITFYLYLNEDIYENGKLIIPKGTMIKEGVTKDGKLIFDNLILGKYIIKEKENNLYQKIEDEEVQLKEESIQLDFLNKIKKGNLTIEKKSDEGKKLKGVVFGIYKDNILIYEGTTNKNGQIILKDLPLGKYVIRELKTLSGYQIENKDYVIEIKENTTTKISVINQKYKMPITSDIDSKNLFYGYSFCILGILSYVFKKII